MERPAEGAAGAKLRLRTFSDSDGRTQRIDGRLRGIDAGVITLATGGEDPVQIPLEDIVTLELGHSDTGRGILGGLAGAAGGLAIGAMICATSNVCDSTMPLWISMMGGATLGAAAGSRTVWEPVTLFDGHAAIQLGARPSGGTAGVAFSF